MAKVFIQVYDARRGDQPKFGLSQQPDVPGVAIRQICAKLKIPVPAITHVSELPGVAAELVQRLHALEKQARKTGETIVTLAELQRMLIGLLLMYNRGWDEGREHLEQSN